MTTVIKKNGASMHFDFGKIEKAVNKAAVRCGVKLSALDFERLREIIVPQLESFKEVEVDTIHASVEKNLEFIDRDVAKAYRDYRNYKSDFAKSWDIIYKQSRDVLFLGDRENANFDSSLNSTKGSLIRGALTKELYKRFEMRQDEIQAIEDGYIYAHDLTNLLFKQINCCLFDAGKVLSGGFEMASIEYTEPKTVHAALSVLGDIALSSTAQQFGGWTLPEIDRILIPYAKKSLLHHTQSIIKEANDLGVRVFDPEIVDKLAHDRLVEELKQGFQSIEMKMNTVPCSRGDFAFTTLSFGNVHESPDADLQRLIAAAILDVRAKGQGKHGRPVVFPKLVYLYSSQQHQDAEQQKLFDKAIYCTSRAMYPDYLSIDSEYGEVSRIFKTHGVVTSPMGCRAYLSEFIDEKTNKAITVGRANIGAVSLNLPMIWMKAKTENKDFYEVLTSYLEITRVFLNRRYDYLAKAPASTNPLAFTQGGLYGGYLKPEDQIGDLVNSFTASFGITALNELNVLMCGKQLHETGNDHIRPVMDFITKFVARAKKEDGRLYALYGSPAESLCGTQLKQFKAMYGEVPGVTDREYFTNSFHMHVTADIGPFEKQDREFEMFHEIPGGHIVYNRITDRNNIAAIKTLCLRGMELGFYQGFNYELAMCDDCGHDDDHDFDECPVCKSRKITTLGRVCGYLGAVKTNGSTRFNDAKLAEFKDRISM